MGGSGRVRRLWRMTMMIGIRVAWHGVRSQANREPRASGNGKSI